MAAITPQPEPAVEAVLTDGVIDRGDTVIGDEKADAFEPRTKIKAWDNDANLSIGTAVDAPAELLSDGTVRFDAPDRTVSIYETVAPGPSPPKSATLRWVDLGEVKPWVIPAEYELSRHVPQADVLVTSYRSSTPSIIVFGQARADQWLDLAKVDVPLVRAANDETNPAWMDAGLHIIDIHDGDPALADAFLNAAQQVLLTDLGLETEVANGRKIYYRDNDGNAVKVVSIQTAWDHSWLYVNVATDYNRLYDYQHADAYPLNDAHARGIADVRPDVDGDALVARIMDRFASIAELSLARGSFTADEQTKLDALQSVHEDAAWVLTGDRADHGWWWGDAEPGYELEVTLKEPPKSNVIEFTVTTKELEFFWQPPERGIGRHRPPFIEGSWAAYHVSKWGNEYGTGKAFHIYRPHATDATGRRVWCEFDPGWDFANDAPLTVTVPQDFLDTAVYPVVVDPTLGYTTNGASQRNGSAALLTNVDRRALLSQTPTEVGHVTSWRSRLQILHTATETVRLHMGLYVAGAGGARNDYSNTHDFPSAVAVTNYTWTETNATGQTINPATSYDVFIEGGGTAAAAYGGWKVSYDTATNAGGLADNTTSWTPTNPPPSTRPALTTNNEKYDLAVDYEGPLDSATLTDTKTIAADLAPSDSATLTDTKEIAAAHEKSDSVTFSDAMYSIEKEAEGTTDVVRSDSATLTDSKTIAVDHVKVDSATLTDSKTIAVDHAKVDAATLTDTKTLAADHGKTDSATLTDGVSITVAATASDSATLTDTKAIDAAHTKTDSATLTDSKTLDGALTATDSGTLTDAKTIAADHAKTDSATLTDAAALTGNLTATDAFTLTDTQTRTADLARSDSATLTDTAAHALAHAKSDSATLTDTGGLTSVALDKSDSVTLTDTSSIDKGGDIVRSDSFTLTDAAAVSVGASASDSATLTESAVISVTVVGADGATVTDTAAIEQARSKSDSATFTESVVIEVTIAATDSVTLTDTVTHRGVETSDVIAWAESATTAAALTVADTITLTDTGLVVPTEYLARADAFAFVDSQVINPDAGIRPGVIRIGDSLHDVLAASDTRRGGLASGDSRRGGLTTTDVRRGGLTVDDEPTGVLRTSP